VLEQQAIVDVLERHFEQHSMLVAKIREGIKRLTELRTALISAAVTGKIDVRDPAA
jgi:type I restriction enzyme S subunit